MHLVLLRATPDVQTFCHSCSQPPSNAASKVNTNVYKAHYYVHRALKFHAEVPLCVVKDLFRNGRNTQLTRIPMGRIEKKLESSQKSNLYENTTLSMSKLRTWSTLIFVWLLLKI